MLVLCTALDVQGWRWGRDPLRALACAAVQVRTGAPLLLDSFCWRSAHSPPDGLGGLALCGIDEGLLDERIPGGGGLAAVAGEPAGSSTRPAIGLDARHGPAATASSPDEGEALRHFDAWIATLPREPAEPVLLSGFAAARDLAYLAAAYEAAGRPCTFSAQPLDIRSLAMGVLSRAWEETAPAQLDALLGLHAPEAAGRDEALVEALRAAQQVQVLLDRLRRRAASEAAFR